MLSSSSTYLLLGASSWGSAAPKSTGDSSVGRAGFGADATTGSGGLGASCPRWGLGAVELLAPTPGLTFGFTLRRALRNMAEQGARGGGPRPLTAPSPGRCPDRGLGTTPFPQSHRPAQQTATAVLRPHRLLLLPAAASSS